MVFTYLSTFCKKYHFLRYFDVRKGKCFCVYCLHSDFYQAKRTWTLVHDLLLCREILVEEPFKFKHGSRERGQHWDKIATSLNQMGKPRFLVDQRSIKRPISKIGKKI